MKRFTAFFTAAFALCFVFALGIGVEAHALAQSATSDEPAAGQTSLAATPASWTGDPQELATPAITADGYGDDVGVRRLYTRSVTLNLPLESSSDTRNRTVLINLENPALDRTTLQYIAVRYKGAKPSVVFVDNTNNKWEHWTVVTATDDVAVPDAGDEHVALFAWADIQSKWGVTNYKLTDMCVMLSGNTTSAEATCRLSEVVALGGEIRTQPTMREPNQQLSAAQIVADITAGYNMSNHLDSHYYDVSATYKDGGWGKADISLETLWSKGVYVSRDTIADLKAKGFNAIRLPITWYQHIYREGDPTNNAPRESEEDPLAVYHIDRAWLDRVHEIVDWCLEQDMYVIVNIHHEDWINRADLDTALDETDLAAKYTAVWTQIATEFDGYDQRLIFEGLNEPRAAGGLPSGREWGNPTDGDVEAINQLDQMFVSTIRALDPDGSKGHLNRLLMVPPHAASTSDASVANFRIPTDPSGMLAVSVHNYTPHNYTHFNDKLPADEAAETWDNNVFTDSYKEDLARSFERIRNRFTTKGIPVIIGEFGSYYNGENQQPGRLAWMTQFATAAKELGTPAFYWRMDRQTSENSGIISWSVYDEMNHAWSAQSSALVNAWLGILRNNDIVLGGNAVAFDDEHADISSEGVAAVLSNASIYTSATSTTSQSDHFNITKELMAGKEFAVKFTGTAPRLALMDSSWKGWRQIEARTVIQSATEDGVRIAYYPADSLDNMWALSMGTPWENTNSDGVVTASGVVGDYAKARVTTQGETTIIKAAFIDASAHVHQWGEWEVATPSTCEAGGLEHRVCTGDETHVQTRETAAHGHDWNAKPTVDVAPTCTTAGSQSVHCSCCDERKDVSEVSALGHDWGEWTVDTAPTCVDEGVEKRVCLRDGTHFETRTLDPTGVHIEDKVGEVLVPPTETEAGERAYRCTVCGTILRTEPIPAQGGGEAAGEDEGGGGPENGGGSDGGDDGEVGEAGENPSDEGEGDTNADAHSGGSGASEPAKDGASKDGSAKDEPATDDSTKDGSGNGDSAKGDSAEDDSEIPDPAAYTGKARAEGFADLDIDAWYMKEGFKDESGKVVATYLDYTLVRGLMSGYVNEDGKVYVFGPNDPLKRAEAVTVLYRMANRDATPTTDPAKYEANRSGLPDVEDRAYYTAAVNWAVESGLVTGYTGESGRPCAFGPDDPLLREQVATITWRWCTSEAVGMAQPTEKAADIYDDAAAISEWALSGVAFCHENGIMTGFGGTRDFGPAAVTERCQMSKVVAVADRLVRIKLAGAAVQSVFGSRSDGNAFDRMGVVSTLE